MAGLAPLAVMMAAALAALMTFGIVTLIHALGRLLPNFSILGVGVKLGQWFDDLAHPLVDLLVQWTNSEWNTVGWCWHIIASIFSTIFGEAVSAIDHIGGQIAHLFTATIPQAVAHAIGDAHAYGDRIVHAMSVAVEHDLHKAIGVLNRSVADALQAVEHTAARDLHVTEQALSHDITAAKHLVEGEVHDLKVSLGRQIASLERTVAADYHDALRAARSDAAGALSTARGLISQAKTEAENVAQADATRVQDLLQQAIDTTNGTVTRLTGTVATDLTAAERYAQGQVAQGVAGVTAQLQQTASQLGASIAAASAAATAGVTGAIKTAQQDANTALGSAEQALGEALAGVYGDLVGKAQAFNGDLSGIEGLLAGAITASIAGVAARVATLEECSVGVCPTSRNPFSSLLKDALGLTELAGVGAFLTQVINDPAAAIQQDAGIISGAVSGGEHLLDQLLAL
jgi:F0F1-type ATP synthase membrane subunit b/b'